MTPRAHAPSHDSALPARSLHTLRVAREATTLARVVYAVTARLPVTERATLGDQPRRAAVSVYANIAEGHGRATRRDALRCYAIAAGSLQALDAHLGFCAEAGLAPPALLADARRRVVRVRKLLDGLRRATTPDPGAPPPARQPPSHRRRTALRPWSDRPQTAPCITTSPPTSSPTAASAATRSPWCSTRAGCRTPRCSR